MRMYRRIGAIALALSVAALATATVVSPLRASASGPSTPSLPDFTNGVPYQEYEPSNWDFDVITGGLREFDTVTFRFDYKNAPPDHLHAAAIGVLNTNSVTIVDYPIDLRPTGCRNPTENTARPIHPHSLKTDAYGQTITLVVDPPGFQAGHTLQFCILGGIGFPVAADTNNDYGITYTEPSGPPVTATYNVTPQGASSHQIHINDSDGYELTNTGIGGGRLATYGTTYAVSITGSAAATYQYSTGYQGDAQVDVEFAGTSTTTTPGGVQTCPTAGAEPSSLIFCTDSNGHGTGILKITSNQPDVTAYITFIGAEQAQLSHPVTESGPDFISITVGSPNAIAPTPHATPTSTPPTSGSPAPCACDAQCVTPYRGNAGLGSLEVYEANTVAIMRAFADECAGMSGLVTYTGVNDTVALNELLTAPLTPYAFAGLDRPMTHQEYVNCTTQSGAPCNNGGQSTGNFGIMQFPIYLQPLVITYNLPSAGPCLTSSLQVSSRLLSAIFTGAVTHWNDPLVKAENQGLGGCNLPILVAHDEGTASAVLKDYMSKQNPQWNAFKDPAAAEAWPPTAPSSCTANGSDAMALCVLGRPGTIGYGFYHAIHRAGLPGAAVATSAGNVSTSSPLTSQPAGYFSGSPVDGCTAAAAANPALTDTSNGGQNPLPRSDWSTISLTDSAVGYPICTFNFLVSATTICRSSANVSTDKGFLGYLGSVISAYTQKKLAEQGYAPLPGNVVGIDNSGMSSLGGAGCQ